MQPDVMIGHSSQETGIFLDSGERDRLFEWLFSGYFRHCSEPVAAEESPKTQVGASKEVRSQV
jgi:hypothetical protein